MTHDRTKCLAAKQAFAPPPSHLKDARWSMQDASAWYAARAWPCGFNYLPASAVNFVDMWQAKTFDAARIDRELGWAADIGLNSPRTNPPFIVWRHDREGLMARIDAFLDIAARRGMTAVLCLMDDCAFSGAPAALGPQRAPAAGVHNSRAVASPGREIVTDQACWPQLEAYVRDLVGRYAQDERILFWDLYNEPGNRMIFAPEGGFAEFDIDLERFSHELMIEIFRWSREIAPSQPLTVGGWRIAVPHERLSERIYTHLTDLTAFELSDIVSFHAYSTLPSMQHILAELSVHGRPLMCTEWMARQAGSRIEEQLPLFCANTVGSWHWGLVNGRTQTHLPWPQLYSRSDVLTENPGEWFHDILRADGSPYSTFEVELVHRLALHYAENASADQLLEPIGESDDVGT